MHSRISTLMRALLLVCAILHIGAFGQVSVTFQHNDQGRTGQNLNETILTPSSVSSGNFGKLFSLNVDDRVLAQTLYLPSVNFDSGSVHNVAFVATENDSVYAFDADSGGTPLWQASLLDAAHGAGAGATPVPESDSGCTNVKGSYGITGTPVIDPSTGTLYVVSATFENNYAVQRLHALNILNGAEKFGGPVTITASVAGTGTGSSGGILTFDPKWEFQRPGLVLTNGHVYIGFGSHCDFGPFHGWLMAYDATTLAQTSVFQVTPNGEGGGIWLSGAAPSVDTENGTSRLFVVTGNGSFDASVPYATNTVDYGDSILRFDLNGGLNVADDFTPMDQAVRDVSDQDLGSGGALILPDQSGPNSHLLVQVGKGNSMFLVNRDNLGGYNSSANNAVQEIDNQVGYLFGLPAYWNNNLYALSASQSLKQFSISNGTLSTTPVASAPQTQAASGLGSTPSISANGTTNGIVWLIDWSSPTQVLYAYDATNVGNMLWNSATNPRDSAGSSIEFGVPTVVNGKVYVATSNQVTVYGMTTEDFTLTSALPSVSEMAGTSATDTLSIGALNGFAGNVNLSASNLPAGVSAKFSASSVPSSSVVTFSTTASAVPGTYPLSITGTFGSLSHTISVSLTITPLPNFSLSASSATLILQPDGASSSVISVTPLYGFSGVPSFSVSGLPSGVSANFLTTTGSGSTLTLSASPSAATGTSTITVTGTAQSLSHSIPLTLTVNSGFAGTEVQMVNRQSGLCLDVTGVSKTVGALLQQWDCLGALNQLWNLNAISGNTYSATSINSGLVLDVQGSSSAAGARTNQNFYFGLMSQKWTIRESQDGFYSLVNARSGKCLDLQNGGMTDGTPVVQSVCSGSDGQQWSFVPLAFTQQVNLVPYYNVAAIGTDGHTAVSSGIDGLGDQISYSKLGASGVWNGNTFAFGPAGAPSAVSNEIVPLPDGAFNELYIIALAVNGSQPAQTFKVNYSDGSFATVQQSISSWNAAQHYANEAIAFTLPYSLTGAGAQNLQAVNAYGYGIVLNSAKTAVSVSLPSNPNVVVLAMTLASNSPKPVPTTRGPQHFLPQQPSRQGAQPKQEAPHSLRELFFRQ